MSKAPRILNLTRGFHLKPSQALRAIENCACAWVERGKTIRDLTLAESIAARSQQRNDPRAKEIKQLRRDGWSCKRIAEKFGISQDLVEQLIGKELPNSEIPGIRYEPCASGQALTRNGYQLISQANRLVLEHGN